jgi:hypothetical protein
MKATNYGRLVQIDDCYISIPIPPSPTPPSQTPYVIRLRSLPEISDSKQATYNTENIIGRSFPLYTFSHSGDRQLSIQLHFFILDDNDPEKNLQDLRAIQSCAYPRRGTGGAPYMPPMICTIQCGHLLAKEPICAVLQSYSVKFPTEVAWYEGKNGQYCPYRFDVDTSWLMVYSSSELPYQDRIFTTGR